MDDVPQTIDLRKEVSKDELEAFDQSWWSPVGRPAIRKSILTDRYRNALREVIEAKIAGREVVVAPKWKNRSSIHDCTQASNEQTTEKRWNGERRKETAEVKSKPTRQAEEPKSSVEGAHFMSFGVAKLQ